MNVEEQITDEDKESIKKLFRIFHRNARSKGFHKNTDKIHALADSFESSDPDFAKYLRSVHRGNRLMLEVGELTEAHDEIRKGQDPSNVYYSESEEVDEPKPEGYLTEQVDVFIRLGDTIGEEDLIDEFVEVLLYKLDFNSIRPELNGKKF